MKKVLNNRNLLLLWSSQAVSSFGTWINFVGLNLYVLKLFKSGKILGLFMMARMLAALFFGPLGGWLADRFPRRRIMVSCDILRAIIVLGFIFTQNLYVFFILGLLLSILDKIFMAANSSFLPDVVEKDDLLDANSLIRMTHSVITVLGPAAGALLVASFTYKSVFIIDSITFVISILGVSLIRGAKEHDEESARKGKKPLEEFKVAYAFFSGHAAIFFLAVTRLIDAVGSGAYNTAMPIFSAAFANISLKLPYLEKTLFIKKGAFYGWLVGVWALGEFTGSLLVRYITNKVKIEKEKIFSFSVIIMALGMGLTFRFNSPWPALVAIYFGGVGDGISNVVFNTVLMKETPDKIRGKVFGATIAFVYTGVALGMALSGWFLDRHPIKVITDWSSLLIISGVIIGYVLYSLKKKRKETTAS